MFLQDGAAGSDGSQHAVGDAPSFHLREEVAHDFVPRAVRHHRVNAAIRNDLDIALAERDEQQDKVTMRGQCYMRGEFPLREHARITLLDAPGHECEPDRKPIEEQREYNTRGYLDEN